MKEADFHKTCSLEYTFTLVITKIKVAIFEGLVKQKMPGNMDTRSPEFTGLLKQELAIFF